MCETHFASYSDDNTPYAFGDSINVVNAGSAANARK